MTLTIAMLLTPVVSAFFLGGGLGSIVSLVIATVVGVAVSAVTLNPGAGIAVATGTFVLVCGVGNVCNSQDAPQSTPPPAAPSAPSCDTLTADPQTIPYPGGIATLAWTTTGADNTHISNVGTVPDNGTTNVSVSNTQTFTLTASNVYGQCSSPKSVTVTVPPPTGPAVTLSRCNVTTDPQNCNAGSSGWGTDDITVITGHQVHLRWQSVNATSCSGSNFATGGSANGTATNVSEPTSSSSPKTFTVQCDDTDPTTPEATAQLRISANDVAPTLTASVTTIRINETFALEWNLNGNDPAQCTITGPGSTQTAQGSMSTQTGTTNIAALGTATYTLSCPGGSDSVSIQVLAEVFES